MEEPETVPESEKEFEAVDEPLKLEETVEDPETVVVCELETVTERVLEGDPVAV